MAKTYLFLFDIVAIATNCKPFSSGAPQFFLSSAAIMLVVWSANGDCSALQASSKVNLLNDDTYQCNSVTIIMPSFKQIEQGAH